MDAMEMFRKKFEAYKQIKDQSGDQTAWDTLMQGYPERQKNNMGHFIEDNTLAEGFTKAIPAYKMLGMDMEVVDISNQGKDAVLEIQKVCPVLEMAKEYGLNPCRVICEMDVAATKAAFVGIQGGIQASIANGDCVCIFKYERPAR